MIKVIGHRGASENAPENTLSSISEAWSQSADGVEVDVRLTKDLKLVCIHDKNTLRTSGKDALVKNTTLEDLRKMDFGAWRGKEWINEPIPVLEEVIELIPKDMKSPFPLEFSCLMAKEVPIIEKTRHDNGIVTLS